MRLFIAPLLILLFAFAGFGQTVDKPLKIKKKPHPAYRGRNCSESSGKTVLEVTFEKTVKIGAVKTIKTSGCTEFDESASRTAFEIEFEPQVRNGEAVTVVKRLVYEYKIY